MEERINDLLELFYNDFELVVYVTGRSLWLKDLPLEELKTFREGLDKNAIQLVEHWIPYIDEVISDKIKELRNSKLVSLFNEYQQKFS